MRLFFIIDETFFFHPTFLNDFVLKTKYTVVGAVVVTSIPRKSSLMSYLISKWYFLTLNEMIKLISLFLYYLFKNLFTKKSKNIYSVKSVLIKNNIFCLEIKNKIDQSHIKQIKELNPDVIISSNSLFLGEEILSIPKKMCINRHSSLLPSYKGLWPIFHAYINKEKYVGVSIHEMNKLIDGGKVIACDKIKIEKNDSIYSLYKKTFKVSVNELNNALYRIKNNVDFEINDDVEESYYSWPKKKDWQEFRKLNGKFI